MAKDYGIWLSYNDQEEGFELPVLPKDIGPSSAGDGSSYEVYGLGKINTIRAPELAEYTIKSFFPAKTYGGGIVTAERVFEPRFYIDLIDKWRQTKRPIRFVYVGSTVDVNLAVSIEAFEWSEVAGSPGDIQYTLDLKEYRFYSARKVDLKTSAATGAKTAQKQAPARPSDKAAPKAYTVASGDTLIKIAKKVYGKDTRWKEIQKLNNLSDAQVKQLQVGQKLKLPA